MKPDRRRISVGHHIAALCLGIVVSIPSIAGAAGVVGTGTADSCTETALDAVLAGGGMVTFNCGGAVTIISTGPRGKFISADTTIDGRGLITISGGGSWPVFGVASGVHFTVRNLTIADGIGSTILDVGGGLLNLGTLTIINCTFADNQANGLGGAILNTGTATIYDSVFTGNRAGDGGGGGIYNLGTLTIVNSAFIGNRAANGGGIYNDAMSGPLNVANSTFINNTAPFGGGGIFGPSIVTNSTFIDNTAELGGGNFAGPVVLRNSIVANGGGGNCAGDIIDGGHNLDDGTSCGFSAASGSLSNANPQLDPAGLKDNGGPTQTVALCTAPGMPAGCATVSPAIDAGDDSVCAAAPVDDRDQRGFVRPGTGHAHCSIGAYEADVAAPCVGDCDGDGMVMIDELILGVNIALGAQPEVACPAFRNNRGVVDIGQLVSGVNNALEGCGGS